MQAVAMQAVAYNFFKSQKFRFLFVIKSNSQVARKLFRIQGSSGSGFRGRLDPDSESDPDPGA